MTREKKVERREGSREKREKGEGRNCEERR